MGHDVTRELVTQNLKVLVIMKASGRTDAEIAKAIGLKLSDFLSVLDEDSYIREKYENAQEKVVTEIEEEFLKNVLLKTSLGETEDAKWYLGRVSPKYQKSEKVEVTVKSIDDIIRERDLLEE
jgi:hypothetical protein